jgi:pilus assembly protein CpaF
MFAVVITEKGGDQRRLEFEKTEVNIGRVQGNDIILPKGNVSKRHSRVVVKDGKFIIVDLKSTNGTYVNGRKITSPMVIKGQDKIYIGDFILHLEDAAAAAAEMAAPAAQEPARRPPPPPPKRKARPTAAESAPPPEPEPELEPAAAPDPRPSSAPEHLPPSSVPVPEPPAPRPSQRQAAPARTAPPEAAAPHPVRTPDSRRAAPRRAQATREAWDEEQAPSSSADPKRQKLFELQKEVHDRLIEYLDLRRMDIDQLADEELWEKTENAICDIVETMDSEGQIPRSWTKTDSSRTCSMRRSDSVRWRTCWPTSQSTRSWSTAPIRFTSSAAVDSR